MLNIRVDKIGEHIKATKQAMRAKLPDLKKVMAEVEDELKREVEVIANARAKGGGCLGVALVAGAVVAGVIIRMV